MDSNAMNVAQADRFGKENEMKARADVERMFDEASEIVSALELIRAGIKLKDAGKIRSGLDVIADNTYSYSGGIVGFQSRVNSIVEFEESLIESVGSGAEPKREGVRL